VWRLTWPSMLAMERYDRDEVAVLVYHVHIPRPDPMTNPDTLGRFAAYDGFSTRRMPIDGKIMTGAARVRGRRKYTTAQRASTRTLRRTWNWPAEAGIRLRDFPLSRRGEHQRRGG